jgi:cell division protein FtsB
MPKSESRRERIKRRGQNRRLAVQAKKIQKMARNLNKMEKRIKDLEDK